MRQAPRLAENIPPVGTKVVAHHYWCPRCCQRSSLRHVVPCLYDTHYPQWTDGHGKNTIVEAVAQLRDRCAVIDYDVLRNMFRKPHLTPWDGEAGHRQNVLGLEHACMLAKSFVVHEYDCIILDVLSDETARLYQENLHGFDPILIQLLPTYEEILRRNRTRPPRLTDKELQMVYDGQAKLLVFDERIDNTHLSAEDVASRVLNLMG